MLNTLNADEYGAYILDFKGSSIKYSKNLDETPKISGGTLQTFEIYLILEDDYRLSLFVENINYSARSFFDALRSPDKNDDKNVVASILKGDDILILSEYSDKALGFSGDDRIYGKKGDDKIWGNEGNDTISGDEGKDILNGGNGSDSLLGGAGTDILTGIDLSDKTRGRNTVDKLTGGNHIDRFILVHDGRKRG